MSKTWLICNRKMEEVSDNNDFEEEEGFNEDNDFVSK
jgi:hypothetical protein